MRHQFSIPVMLIFATVICALEARAESRDAYFQFANWRPAVRVVRDEKRYRPRILFSVPQLAYLPNFSSEARFLDGMDFPNAKGVHAFQFHYATRYQPKSIIDWYRTALMQAGWKIEIGPSNSHIVTASRDGGLHCTVVAVPTSMKNQFTEFRVSYQSAQ